MRTTIKMTGTPNLGRSVERTEEFVVEKKDATISIQDSEGKVLISFAPFFDGGSVWLSDFSSIIMDKEHWGEDKNGKFKMLWKQEQAIANVSVGQIMKWKEDSEKLEKIREAERLKRGDEE